LRVGMRPSYAMPTSISQRFSGAETDDFRESPIPERARQGLGFNPCFSFGDAGTFLARFLIISNACAPHSSPTKTGRTGLESLNASIFIFGCDGTHGLIDYLLQTIIFSSFTGRTPVTRTYQASGIGLLEGLLPSCTVNRAQSPRRSHGRVVSGHSDGRGPQSLNKSQTRATPTVAREDDKAPSMEILAAPSDRRGEDRPLHSVAGSALR